MILSIIGLCFGVIGTIMALFQKDTKWILIGLLAIILNIIAMVI